MIENFANEMKLLIRLRAAFDKKQKFTFLIGSGLTAPNYDRNELGVGNVKEIVSDIGKIFVGTNKNIFEKDVLEMPASDQYQAAMKLLLDCYGQDELNKVIVHAVLKARLTNSLPTIPSGSDNPLELENDFGNWFLRKGIDALGELFVDFHTSFSGPILTSNFDPLIEISIRKHGGTPQSMFLVNDGKFSNSFSRDIHNVLHFHGYWTGSDTLHTIDQLTRYRPQLKGDLRQLLGNSILVVLGYGGWNDVFTTTLLELIAEGGNNINVLWTFFSSDEDLILKSHKNLLDKLSPSIGQRVVLYKGIDCDQFLPKLLTSFNEKNDISPDLTSTEAERENAGKSVFECDTPPNNTIWVGRSKEIDDILKLDFKTCFITGIGGQGKSGLASHLVKNVLSSVHGYEYWDWRDCKEEDNRIHTIITLIIERLTNGKIRAINLQSETTDSVIELFFSYLGNRKIFFVFDNVDKYIDYEKLCPEKGLGKIFDLANTLDHKCKFIFTCRPTVQSAYSTFFEVKLRPLTLEEATELFVKNKVSLKKEEIINVAKEAHLITGGHPLWLQFIIAQAKSGFSVVNNFLKDIREHKIKSGDEKFYSQVDNTLNVIWNLLNENQQLLLRCLGESVTALTDQQILTVMDSELSANQCGKCLRKLISLNLLVIKSSETRSDLYELHPLVKEFILNRFQKNERARFIMLLVKYYDAFILVIKPKLDADSPLNYFLNWTNKVELQVNKEDYQEALIVLQEVTNPILSAGFYDEYLRVAFLLFTQIDWLKAITEEYPYFHEQVENFLHTLIEYSNFNEADAYLEKYAKNISGKGEHYINYCKNKADLNWNKADFQTAIDWSEKGLQLLGGAELNTNKEPIVSHYLALALRDTKTPANMERALKIFLNGENVDNILKHDINVSHFAGNFYGNVGRCLWFMGDIKKGLSFYKKSVLLLKNEKAVLSKGNLGYGLYWIGEALEAKKDFESAYYFYRRCLFFWGKVAPIRGQKVEKDIQRLFDDSLISKDLKSTTDLKIEILCLDFLNNSSVFINESSI